MAMRLNSSNLDDCDCGRQRPKSRRQRPHRMPGDMHGYPAISCATVGNDLHVLAVNNGDVWHTIRYGSGTWKATFDTPPGQGSQAAYLAVAGAGVR